MNFPLKALTSGCSLAASANTKPVSAIMHTLALQLNCTHIRSSWCSIIYIALVAGGNC